MSIHISRPALLVLLLTACQSPDSPLPDADELSVSCIEQPILGGAEVPTGALESLGIATVIGPNLDPQTASLCSGVLVTNQHVLTVKGCTSQDLVVPGPLEDVRVAFGSETAGRQSRTVTRIVWSAGVGPANDLALLTLDAPVSVRGSTSSMSHRPFAVPNGTQVLCAGVGGAEPFGLRSGTMTVKQTVGMVEVPRNQLGQMAQSSDLGSPCMPLTDLSPTAPFIGVFDYNLGDVAYYTPASTTSAFLKPLILAGVTASIDTVPQYFGSLPGVLKGVDDERVALVSSTPTTSTPFAPRATSVTLSVDGSPAGYACAADSTVVPLAGAAQLKTTCLQYGLLYALVSAT